MSSNSNTSSLASDLSRIVLLGIAFDISRSVARGVLDVVLSSVRTNASLKERSQHRQHEVSNDYAMNGREVDGSENKELSLKPNGNNGILLPSSVEIIEQSKLYLDSLKRLISDNIHNKKYIGLVCYLLFPPPLLLFGAWDYLQGSSSSSSSSSKSQQLVTSYSSVVFGGLYLSSVVTSFGLLWWIWPESTVSGDDHEYNIINDKNKGDGIGMVQAKQQQKALSEHQPEDKSPKIISSIPSAINVRPPLPPIPSCKQSNEPAVDRLRPRSDSIQSFMSESSARSPPTTGVEKSGSNQSQKKYLEILVHNVSHTDLILGLAGDQRGGTMFKRTVPVPVPFPAEFEDTPRKKNVSQAAQQQNSKNANVGDEKYIMCRPRFSAFDLFSRRVLSELQGQMNKDGGGTSSTEETKMHPGNANIHPLHQKTISYPRYERSNKTARYTLVTPRPSDQYMLPVGFNLERTEGGINNTAVDPTEMPSLRIRGRDLPKLDPSLLGETPRKLNVLPHHVMPTIHSPVDDSGEQQAEIDTPVTPGRNNAMQEILRINAVFFPLLATLLPRWLGQIADKFGVGDTEDNAGSSKKVTGPVPSPNVKKVVVLVSGVGTPRNWTHSISGNSTQACAELMELFIHVLYPDITVVRIHSETNIFRYDENISFATHELMPIIDNYRDANARSQPYPDEIASAEVALSNTELNPFNPDWKQSVSVTYSFADGSAARSHAIQAALRPYRPNYFHFWQLKTFWHDSKISDEDIEVHSFEDMETVPAMAADQTSDIVSEVVDEMKAHRKHFLDTFKDGGRSDLKSFWLRKTKKPVLSILLVKEPDGKHKFYRGLNMEVSMPTGSLCAERNAIGNALADNPGLNREDMLMVAVLSVPLPEVPVRVHLPPPGPASICQPVMSSTRDSADFVREVGDKLKQHQAQSGGMRRNTSTQSFASIAEDKPQVASPKTIENEWEMDGFQSVVPSGAQPMMSPLASPLLSSTQVISPTGRSKDSVLIPELNLSRLPEASPSSNVSGQSTPKRRISLYQKKSNSKIGGGVKKRKQALLVQSHEDMNPLKPCGACNEWLKKIAESNPHFKVLTFTDTECNGVYVSPCQD